MEGFKNEVKTGYVLVADGRVTADFRLEVGGVNAAVDYTDKDYNWGPSSFDRTHIFVGTWSWALPFFRGDRGFLGQALGGWEISGIARYQTGEPLTVTGNTAIGGRRADYLDFFNAFNQANWGNPALNRSVAGFGTVTSANPARNIQLGARIMF